MATGKSWSEQTERELLAAGWYPGRRDAGRVAEWRNILENSKGFRMSPAAATALEEFGGIRVSAHGPGAECARGGFDLDPALAVGEEDRFDGFGKQYDLDLFPLGEAFDGHAFLGIDRLGRVYLVGDDIRVLGNSIEIALDAILDGRLPTRLAGT